MQNADTQIIALTKVVSGLIERISHLENKFLHPKVRLQMEADKVLLAALPPVQDTRFKMKDILASIARDSNVPAECLRSVRRVRKFAWPRQDAMLVMHEEGYSYCEIGRFLLRDHTTVRHGIASSRTRRADAHEKQTQAGKEYT